MRLHPTRHVHLGRVNFKPTLGRVADHKSGTAHIGDVGDGFFGGQAMRHFHQGAFGVAIQQQIRFGIDQDSATHLVLPIVVMRYAAQRCFNAADDDGDIRVSLTTTLAVDQHAAVGALAPHTAWCVSVVTADFAVCGVTVDHGVHVARGHTIKQIGFAKRLKRLGTVPLGLGDDAYPEPLRFQHATNDSHAKTGVVHIGVAGDQNDVATVPAQLRHLGTAHWQKRRRAKPRCPVFAVTGQGLGNALKKGDIKWGVHQPLILGGICGFHLTYPQSP